MNKANKQTLAIVKREAALHLAVCQAVAVLSTAVEVARLKEGREVSDILRKALVDWADAYDQNTSNS